MNTLTFDNHWEAKTNSFNKRMDKMREELCRYEAKHHLREKTSADPIGDFSNELSLAILRFFAITRRFHRCAISPMQISRSLAGGAVCESRDF